ncbi:MAG: type II toxin-antitoxin system VapC family toxin [Chloroflexota bacterium]
MGILLDTNILVRAEKGSLNIAQKIIGREEEDFFISVITASELLHGVFRANSEAIQNKRSAFVEKLLTELPILQIDLTTARAHAKLWADLQSKGEMIGAHDAWIGAACIAYGLTIVTGNANEFSRIPGLAVESW